MEIFPKPEASGLLTAGVRHEVNNPLSYVMGNLEYLAKRLTELRRSLPPSVADELDETARDAMDGAKRIRHLMGALAAMQQEGTEQEAAELDLGDVVESALSVLRNRIRQRATLLCAIDVAPRVMAGERELTQVFVSILRNALESLPTGRALQSEIRVVSHLEGDNAVVEITDSGTGIRPEHRSRIFEPFFTTKGADRGAGLGLSLARNSLRAFGGQIEVRSQWERGTTVRVSLPVARTITQPVEVTSPLKSGRARILVIDDDSLVGRAIKRVLIGHDVTSVDCGEEAIALLQRDPNFDVILCDLMMPRMTGGEVQARVRAFSPDLAERFSFITGGACTQETATFVEKTARPVMQKPLMTNELRGAVERELAAHRIGTAGRKFGYEPPTRARIAKTL